MKKVICVNYVKCDKKDCEHRLRRKTIVIIGMSKVICLHSSRWCDKEEMRVRYNEVIDDKEVEGIYLDIKKWASLER